MHVAPPHQSFSFEKCSDIYDKCTQKALLPMARGKGKRICYHHGGDQSWPHHPSFQQVGATAPAPQQGWAWGPTQDLGIRGSVFPEGSSSSSSITHFWSLSSHSKAPLVVLPQCFSVPCSVGGWGAATGTSLHRRWPRHTQAATMGKDFPSWLWYPAKVDKNKRPCGLVQSTPPWHLRAQKWLFLHPCDHYHSVFVLPHQFSAFCGFAVWIGYNAYLWALWLCRSL